MKHATSYQDDDARARGVSERLEGPERQSVASEDSSGLPWLKDISESSTKPSCDHLVCVAARGGASERGEQTRITYAELPSLEGGPQLAQQHLQACTLVPE